PCGARLAQSDEASAKAHRDVIGTRGIDTHQESITALGVAEIARLDIAGEAMAVGLIQLTQGSGIRRDERKAGVAQEQKACGRRTHPGSEPIVVGAKLCEALELEAGECVGTAAQRRTHWRERILPLAACIGGNDLPRQMGA